MIFDKQKISNRALRFLEHPQFFGPSLDKSFSLILDEHDKILTAHHCFAKETNEFQALLAEVACVLSKGKVLFDLWALSYREFENFVRDENHLPAFLEHEADLEVEFSKLKLVLLASGYSQKLRGLESSFNNWGHLSLVQKNKITSDLCQKLGWNLIYAEESAFYVQTPFSWGTNDNLTFFVNEALGGSLQKAAIKVVAVLG